MNVTIRRDLDEDPIPYTNPGQWRSPDSGKIIGCVILNDSGVFSNIVTAITHRTTEISARSWSSSYVYFCKFDVIGHAAFHEGVIPLAASDVGVIYSIDRKRRSAFFKLDATFVRNWRLLNISKLSHLSLAVLS